MRSEERGGKPPIPVHVGIVMDGNGRWAKKRHLPRILGHHAGVGAVERTVRAAKDLGIRYLSLYAFSTENWHRSHAEVSGLMALFRHYLRIKVEALREEDARLRFAGRLEGLPEDIREILADAERRTREGGSIQMIVCLNYGGRQEILDAANRLLRERREEDGPVDEAAFRAALYLPDVPDPDLLIRTSGEQRMSNFWLYEGAYSEYYFTDLLWPDFGMDELKRALEDYAGRERRYGRA